MLKFILIPLLIGFLPIEDSNSKMQIGIILGELLSSNYINNIIKYLKCCRKKQITIPDHTKDREFNPLFDKVQDYLTVKFSKMIESCELIPKNGDVEFSLTDISGKRFTDQMELSNGKEHIFELYIEQSNENPYDEKSDACKQIVVSSKTASSEDIKEYVKKISTIKVKGTNMIKIYRPIIHGKKKEDRTIEWEHILVKTSKTLQNTIYSKEIEKELFEDIDRFMLSEDWYAQRGMPYKRGYFLHSKPGQGKTSVAKIVANKYSCSVFCLDITTIDDNATLTKLMTEINYYTCQERYILLIEDADRTDFMNPRYRDPKLSMDCFLNAIDGVAEPYGRIILMSANDPECILKNKALIRPGRIDKIIEIKSCDVDQIKRMYELFYGDLSYKVDWDNWEFNKEMTAAYIIKLLQENVGKPELFMRLIGDSKITNSNNIILDDGVIKAIELAKAEQNDIPVNHRRKKNRKGRSCKYSNTLESKIKRTKKSLKITKKNITTGNKSLEKINYKLPILLEKLKQKKEKEYIKKSKEKARRKVDYLKKINEVKENNEVSEVKENSEVNENGEVKENNEVSEYNEEEYETPAFLINSIDISLIPKDAITTYEIMED